MFIAASREEELTLSQVCFLNLNMTIFKLSFSKIAWLWLYDQRQDWWEFYFFIFFIFYIFWLFSTVWSVLYSTLLYCTLRAVQDEAILMRWCYFTMKELISIRCLDLCPRWIYASNNGLETKFQGVPVSELC